MRMNETAPPAAAEAMPKNRWKTADIIGYVAQETAQNVSGKEANCRKFCPLSRPQTAFPVGRKFVGKKK